MFYKIFRSLILFMDYNNLININIKIKYYFFKYFKMPINR